MKNIEKLSKAGFYIETDRPDLFDEWEMMLFNNGVPSDYSCDDVSDDVLNIFGEYIKDTSDNDPELLSIFGIEPTSADPEKDLSESKQTVVDVAKDIYGTFENAKKEYKEDYRSFYSELSAVLSDEDVQLIDGIFNVADVSENVVNVSESFDVNTSLTPEKFEKLKEYQEKAKNIESGHSKKLSDTIAYALDTIMLTYINAPDEKSANEQFGDNFLDFVYNSIKNSETQLYYNDADGGALKSIYGTEKNYTNAVMLLVTSVIDRLNDKTLIVASFGSEIANLLLPNEPIITDLTEDFNINDSAMVCNKPIVDGILSENPQLCIEDLGNCININNNVTGDIEATLSSDCGLVFDENGIFDKSCLSESKRYSIRKKKLRKLSESFDGAVDYSKTNLSKDVVTEDFLNWLLDNSHSKNDLANFIADVDINNFGQENLSTLDEILKNNGDDLSQSYKTYSLKDSLENIGGIECVSEENLGDSRTLEITPVGGLNADVADLILEPILQAKFGNVTKTDKKSYIVNNGVKSVLTKDEIVKELGVLDSDAQQIVEILNDVYSKESQELFENEKPNILNEDANDDAEMFASDIVALDFVKSKDDIKIELDSSSGSQIASVSMPYDSLGDTDPNELVDYAKKYSTFKEDGFKADADKKTVTFHFLYESKNLNEAENTDVIQLLANAGGEGVVDNAQTSGGIKIIKMPNGTLKEFLDNNDLSKTWKVFSPLHQDIYYLEKRTKLNESTTNYPSAQKVLDLLREYGGDGKIEKYNKSTAEYVGINKPMKISVKKFLAETGLDSEWKAYHQRATSYDPDGAMTFIELKTEPERLNESVNSKKSILKRFFESKKLAGFDGLWKLHEGVDAPIQTYADMIPYNSDGKILLLQRNPDCDFEPNKWGFAGGKVQVGEITKQGAIRECLEESGVNVDNVSKIGEFSNPDGSVSHYYKGDATNEVNLGNESQNYIWIDPSDVVNYDLIMDNKDRFNLVVNGVQPTILNESKDSLKNGDIISWFNKKNVLRTGKIKQIDSEGVFVENDFIGYDQIDKLMDEKGNFIKFDLYESKDINEDRVLKSDFNFSQLSAGDTIKIKEECGGGVPMEVVSVGSDSAFIKNTRAGNQMEIKSLKDYEPISVKNLNEASFKDILSSLASGDLIEISSLISSPKKYAKASLGRIILDRLNKSGIVGDKATGVVDSLLKVYPAVSTGFGMLGSLIESKKLNESKEQDLVKGAEVIVTKSFQDVSKNLYSLTRKDPNNLKGYVALEKKRPEIGIIRYSDKEKRESVIDFPTATATVPWTYIELKKSNALNESASDYAEDISRLEEQIKSLKQQEKSENRDKSIADLKKQIDDLKIKGDEDEIQKLQVKIDAFDKEIQLEKNQEKLDSLKKSLADAKARQLKYKQSVDAIKNAVGDTLNTTDDLLTDPDINKLFK